MLCVICILSPHESHYLMKMCSEQDILDTNQSLRIISNLVAAGAFNASGRLDELISELLVFSGTVISMKSSEVYDLIAKVYC